MTAAQRMDGGGANDLWHYAVGSERKGPVPRPTIAKLLASGEISAETYVWQPGMDNWVHLGDAPSLKPLVAGIDGDGSPEEFVEEDTAFTSPADIIATHHELDDDDDAGELTGDTIVDSQVTERRVVEDVALRADFITDAASPGPATQPQARGASPASKERTETPVRPLQPMTAGTNELPVKARSTNVMAAVVSPQPQESIDALLGHSSGRKGAADEDSGLLGEVASSTTGASTASGSDIFSVSAGGPSTEDDIFGGSAPASEAEEIAGVHGRRQSSVLFTLDELGREGGAKRTGNEQFVTDSSGLIDIKAIATNEKRSGGDDPFGSAPSLVLPGRQSPAAMSIPLVERKRNNGPWILAAAALLLIGGIAIALIVSGGDDEPAAPPVVASNAPVTNDPGKTVGGATDGAKDPAKSEAADPKATAEGGDKDPKAAAAGDPAAKAGDPTNPTAGDKAEPAANTDDPNAAKAENPAGEGDKAATEVKAAEPAPKPDVKKPTTDKPRTAEPKRPTTREEDKPARVEASVEPVAPAPVSNAGNTAKVNDLLSKLNKADDKKDTAPVKENDSSLPDKLSAATVRNTIKGRFGKCGGMISNASGSVTVQTQFVISSSGVVQSARVSNGGGTSPDVQRCVVSVIKQTTFAKFREPTMQVNLPVRLL